MSSYYAERAALYDELYRTPAYRDDLRRLAAWLRAATAGRSVLEVAAGTGHWTAAAAPGARHITATDIDPAPLALARRRRLGRHVAFRTADAYRLPRAARRFDVGMAHLWWSHVPIERRQEFLAQFAARLAPGALLLMIDQLPPVRAAAFEFRRDENGNRYELRHLPNGRFYEVAKNYPAARELRRDLAAVADAVVVHRHRFFWAVEARLRD